MIFLIEDPIDDSFFDDIFSDEDIMEYILLMEI